MKHKLIGVATVFTIAFIFMDIPGVFLIADILSLCIMFSNDNEQENWFKWLKRKMDRM